MSPVRTKPLWGWLLLLGAVVAGISIPLVFARLASETDQLREARRQSIIVTCQETNARHDATLRKLDELIAALPPGPRKKRAKQNRAGTVLLIKTLAPKHDCEARADRLTNPEEVKP